MQSIYRLNASELNQLFLEGLKAIFEGQEIEIIVQAVDETAYLFQSEANRDRLLVAKSNIEQGKDLAEQDSESR